MDKSKNLKSLIKNDLIVSILHFLDRFYLNRSLQEKLKEQLQTIWSRVQNTEFIWDSTPYRSLGFLKTNFYQPARLRCIFSMTEVPKILIPQFFPEYLNEIFHTEIPYENAGNIQSMVMHIQEPSSGDTLLSLRIADSLLLETIPELQNKYTSFDLLCCTLPFPVTVGKTGIHLSPYLLIRDIRPVTNPLQLIKAEDTDIETAKEILAKAKNNDGIFSYIRQQIISHLKIANLERNKLLDMALSAVIVQAFSDGWIQNASGKISCLIAGAPGSGKKLLSRCAEALNPIFTTGEPSKLSIAGICSSTQKKADAWISRPGLIPLAHLGTFNLQDFHIIRSQKKQAIIGSLYRVLEDGIVIDSTSSQISHEALTSILVDMNKTTDLSPENETHKNNGSNLERRLADLGLPLPLLSRFDFIVDIPRDINQQIDIALELHKKNMTFTAQHAASDQDKWTKNLKLLVAYLRQKHRDKITFSKETRDYIKEKHIVLVEEFRPLMVQYEHFSDFIIRLTISIYRFSAAIAMMNDRNSPLKEDVDFAFEFVRQKMAFVKSLVEDAEEKKEKTDKLPRRKERQRWILKYFAGREIKINLLIREFEKFYGIKIDPMTLRIDLKDLTDKGVKPTRLKGYYYIPEKREQDITFPPK